LWLVAVRSTDWHSDGNDSTNCEDNFGSVRFEPTGNPALPFEPKPYYTAVATLQEAIGSAQAFSSRAPASDIVPSNSSAGGSPSARDVFVLLFSGSPTGPGGVAVAAWTNATYCPSAAPSVRTGCGPSTQAACVLAGCCWDDVVAPLEPQCFYGTPVAPVSVTVEVPLPPQSCFAATGWLGGPAQGTNGTVCTTADAHSTSGASNVTLLVTDGPVYLS
jgi:hypothetical protein